MCTVFKHSDYSSDSFVGILCGFQPYQYTDTVDKVFKCSYIYIYISICG